MDINLGFGAFKFYVHPIFVHFPIALFFLEAVLLFIAVRNNAPEYVSFARFTFWMGFYFLLVAAVAGVLDAGGPDEIVGAVRKHFLAALTVEIVYIYKAFRWCRKKEPAGKDLRFQLYLSIAGYSLILITGWLGGMLVYS